MESSACPTCGRAVVETVSLRRPIVLQPADRGQNTHIAVYVIEDDIAVQTLFPRPGQECFLVHRCTGKAAA